MENLPVVITAIVVLLGLLLVGVSVAISLASSGIVGLVLLSGFDVTSSVIAGTSYSAVANGSLIVVPMFVLMGMLTLYSGIAEQLFAIASKVLRKIPGSLAMATVFASAGFGAISGSSLATVATLGRTCITEMMRHGYLRSFASATVAASGTLAVLIPPSIILVLYGVTTGESIGALLIAGIVPGILSALMLAGAISLRTWRRPALVSQGNETELRLALAGDSAGASGATDEANDRDDAAVSLTFGSVTRAVVGVAVLFTIVIGGIYSGVFTASESAAVGAFAALVLICSQYATRPKLLRTN
ncbi:MAG: TRAP transporter large permease subunit, partial [Nocardioidaceae bacterium]